MIPGHTRIYVCAEPQDMRLGFDRLAQAARQHLKKEPSEGALFVFLNKRLNRTKILWFETNGSCLLYKRLDRARFVVPKTQQIDLRELGRFLRGVKRT